MVSSTVLPNWWRFLIISHAWRRAVGIEPGGRFVEEQQLGIADQPEGDVEAALLPARQRLDACRGLLVEPDDVDDIGDARGGR